MSSQSFGVVSTGAGSAGRTEDNTLDVDGLPERFREAVEADDFVIYGKASIEQYDTDDVPTMIDMDALEGALGRFFASEDAPGVISIGHKDVVVGRPLESYTLDEPRTVIVGDETYEFDAGDTLQAHVADNDDDGRPELWLPAQIDGETEYGMKSRIRILAGEISGYSVTVRRNKAEWTDEGRRITECDLHAVTLGTDEQIRNKGSEFGVAEYKGDVFALNSPDDAVSAGIVEGRQERVHRMGNIFDKLLGQELEAKGQELQEAAEDEPDDEQEQKGDTPGDDDVPEDEPEDEEKADADPEEVAAAMAEMMGISVEEAMAMLQDGGPEGESDDEDDPEDGEMKSDDEEGDGKALTEADLEAKLDELGVVRQGDLEETVEDKLDAQADRFEDTLGEFVEDVQETVESKMETGSTPAPSSGSAADDLQAQISESRDRHGSK